MAETPCPQCGRMVEEEELLCPHCGGALIPQYSRRQLQTALGQEREGTPRAPMGVGCLLGLLAGVGIAFLLPLEPGENNERLRWKLQGELVFLMGIGGVLLGLVYTQWRSLRQRKRRGPPGAAE
jgi:hypothetical protein